MAVKGLANSGNTGIHRGGRKWAGYEEDFSAAQFDQMFGHHETAGHIIDAHQIKIASAGIIEEIPIQEHDGDTGFSKGFGQVLVGFALSGLQFSWREKDAAYFAIDELFADFLGMHETGIRVDARVGGTAPQQTIFIDASEAGDFTADNLEDFGIGEAGDQQAQNAGRCAALVIGADVGARAGAAIDQALGLQIAQGAGHGGPRNPKLLDQLNLARQTGPIAIFAAGNFGFKMTAYLAVFWL